MVYDCFIFFNELEILEIRLEELDSVVDKFVLVEADRTFQNNPKPFIFDENKERFAQYLHKIIHIKLTEYPRFIPILNPFSPWKLEFYQRNSIVKGLTSCKPEDIILISDVDEILKADVIKQYIDKGVNQIYGIKMDMFMYFFNNKVIYDKGTKMSKEESKDGLWHCSVMLPYKLLKKKPYRLRKIVTRTKRKGEVYPIIPNGGWHFSYMGGFKNIRTKLESFSHTEYNLDQYKDEKFINDIILKGKDLFGRDIEFEVVDPQTTMPQYLKEKSVQEELSNFFIQPKDN